MREHSHTHSTGEKNPNLFCFEQLSHHSVGLTSEPMSAKQTFTFALGQSLAIVIRRQNRVFGEGGNHGLTHSHMGIYYSLWQEQLQRQTLLTRWRSRGGETS
jgi:hypothetical protein